jgi:hypothetical protein
MTKNATSQATATATGAWLERARTPFLVLAMLALGGGVVTTEVGTKTELASRYHAAFVLVVVAAAVALAIALALPAPSGRPKLITSLTTGAGVAMGAVALNGMLAGPSRWMVAGAALAAFAVATAAILVDLETTRDRPVSRL